MKIKAKILSDKITPEMLLPKTSGSAGIDLMAVKLPSILDNRNSYFYAYPNQCTKIGTGIAIHLDDPGYAAIVLPRSGMGHKGLVLGNLIGLIDSDFSSEIILSVWNRSNEPIRINSMDRIAQLIIVPVIQPVFDFIDEFCVNNNRGSFGSTGVT